MLPSFITSQIVCCHTKTTGNIIYKLRVGITYFCSSLTMRKKVSYILKYF